MSQHKIIKTLDNPTRFLFWNASECMILILACILGGALESLTVVLIGGALWYSFRKINRIALKKSVTPFHFLYWNLPTSVLKKSGKFRALPCSHKRDIVL